MSCTRLKQQLKVDVIVDGIRICKEISLLWNENYSDLKEGKTRALSIFALKIQLAVTGIITVENTLDWVLRYDGNYDLYKRLTHTAEYQENVEKKIKECQQQDTPHVARKRTIGWD